jgi:putative transposase
MTLTWTDPRYDASGVDEHCRRALSETPLPFLVRNLTSIYTSGNMDRQMQSSEADKTRKRPVNAVKSIAFRYRTSEALSSLFEDFRLMCNDAIRIALTQEPKSRFDLIALAYHRLKEYDLHTHYILSACEVAYSVYKNKNRKKVPYIRKAFIKLDNQSYTLNHLLLRIPTVPRHFIFLTLEGSNYHLSLINDLSLKRGSITITERAVSISLSNFVSRADPTGFVGVDVNERNVTISATNGFGSMFSELGEVAEIKERYREIRAKISKLTRHDNRIRRKLLAKYGEREKNRTVRRIHEVSSEIVRYAKENRFGIKMEKLTGIRKKFRRWSGQGTSYRARLNSWVFGETQRQIGYKAAWLGVPVHYVNPRGTSSNCPDCGSRVANLQDRKLYCPTCDKTWDRDDLASKNIMACAVPQARPLKGSNERERGGDGSNPSSGWEEAKTGGQQ